MSKITPEQAEKIRNDPRSETEIAKEYGLTRSYVHAVREGLIKGTGQTGSRSYRKRAKT